MIVLAVASLSCGICAAASQTASEQHEQEADLGQVSARLMRERQDEVHTRHASASLPRTQYLGRPRVLPIGQCAKRRSAGRVEIPARTASATARSGNPGILVSLANPTLLQPVPSGKRRACTIGAVRESGRREPQRFLAARSDSPSLNQSERLSPSDLQQDSVGICAFRGGPPSAIQTAPRSW